MDARVVQEESAPAARPLCHAITASASTAAVLTRQRPDVVSALHATKKDTAWVECDGKVGHELQNRESPASVTILPQILEAGVPILMFAGAEDLICNAEGIRRVCDGLKWDGLLGMGVSFFSYILRRAWLYRGESPQVAKRLFLVRGEKGGHAWEVEVGCRSHTVEMSKGAGADAVELNHR